jgi:hypothetical protein
MPARQGTLHLLDDAVFEVVALPASAFPGADDDGDGRLSDAEVSAHEASLRAALAGGYRLFDGDLPGTLELVLVRAEHDERSEASTAGAPGLVALLKTRFPAPPLALRLETSLLAADASGGRGLTVRATRAGEVETAVLTPDHPAHRFFRGPIRSLLDRLRSWLEGLHAGGSASSTSG